MNAKQLYQVYVDFHEEQNCEVDAWEDLDDRDRGAWEAVAAAAGGQ